MEFICGSDGPIVQTKAGKLRGFSIDGTYTFYGVRYATARRFHMPVPVEPWDGVKDALSYSPVCPVISEASPHGNIRIPHRYWPQGEDCLSLNIWTRSLDPEAKKPVMVWIHGGGFANGSSLEMVAYDGEALAVNGDVVVVTLNHRLNMLGYLDLSSYGEEYKNSGCVGIADLVTALEWVRDNIGGFGGDPSNVTLFGQSGGGGKIQVLMQTPAAEGLFGKVILQSGVIDFGPKPTPEGHKKLVGAMMENLGISEAAQLETVPYRALVGAYNAAAPALRNEGIDVGWAPMPGDYYIGDAREVGFCDFAKKVVCLVGSVFGEFAGALPPKKDELGEDERRAAVAAKYGELTDEVIAEYHKAYPGRNIVDLLSLDSAFRKPNLDFLDKRAAVSEVPMYAYLFALDFPIDDGTPAWHCSEIPFVFHNIDRVPVCGAVGVAEKLQEQLCTAWSTFARTGDPNCDPMPHWEPYNNSKTTMVIDRTTEAKQGGFDRKLVELAAKAAPFRRF